MTAFPVPPAVVSVKPLDPRTRALVIGIRAALLLLADVLGEYAGLPKRAALDNR